VTASGGRRALLVSSFVRPHPGGVEEFVDEATNLLRKQGWEPRILACRLPGVEAAADVVVPTRFLGASAWPLPVGGWRTLWHEVGQADVVVANNARHVLPALAVLVARARGRAAVLIVHGSGEGAYAGSRLARVVRAGFQRTLGRWAVRLSHPASVSLAGVDGVRRLYGAQASYVPYPVRALSEPPPLGLRPEEPMRVAWVGRLFPEKDPLAAVSAVEVLRHEREATLEVCGDGPLRPALERLARERPWLLLRGSRGWDEAQAIQGNAHVCLATSVADNVQVAVLEALCRSIPTVSTRVGDAPSYYLRASLANLCVHPRDADAAGRALLAIASSYDEHRREFAENAGALRARHAAVGEALARLLADAVHRGR
jgi:glycosyltransferase involved in cell wall biosynthesis